MFIGGGFLLSIQGREVADVSGGWGFGGMEKMSSKVDLPHVYGHCPAGPVKFGKSLSVKPEQGKRYFLDMGGISQKAQMFVNGKLAGEHNGAFARFCVEITGYLKEKDNHVEIIMRNASGNEAENKEDGYGIREGALLLKTGPVCISPEFAGGRGVVVAQERVTHSEGKVRVSTILSSSSDKEEDIDVIVEIRDPRGYVAADSHREVNLAAGQRSMDVQHLTLIHPLLWQGRDNPYMHEITVTVTQAGKELDKVTIPLGLRKLEYDPVRGLVLNGHYLKGEMVDPFLAMKEKTEPSARRKEEAALQFMRSSKAETIWLLSDERSREFYGKCDREGFILCQSLLHGPFNSSFDLDKIRDAVFEKGVHPSICIWNVPLSGLTSKDNEAVMDCFRILDPERKVIFESHRIEIQE